MANFVNPYNFIPLPERDPERSEVRKGEYTGVISFTLRTRTPLVIPNTSNEDAFKVKDKNGNPAADHKSYDFFSYDDLSDEGGTRTGIYSEPVIPGSEIRGMLRSYYEILSNSCMSFVDDEEVLSKRTNEVYKPGLLERQSDGTFVLHKAEDCLYREGSMKTGFTKLYETKRFKEGQEVFFTYVKREGLNEKGKFVKAKPLAKDVRDANYSGAKKGYVIKGEAGPEITDAAKKYTEKHNCHIFIDKGVARPLDTKEIQTLDTAINVYKDNEASEYEKYARKWDIFKQGQGGSLFPVYYSQFNDKAKYMLSPASITREIYYTKLRDIIGKHCSCSKKDKLCPACALFGMIGKKFHISSRIRVADMRLGEEYGELFANDPGSLFEKEVTLEALSSPKLNNMEFYLKKPDNAWFWTYDYYIDENGKVHKYVPQINGRKFYWHQPDMKIKSDTDPDKLNTTVRPLKQGAEFTGKVYFDHLTETELNLLIYTIEAGDKGDIRDKKHCYKLGHAKPLGFGSVALSVDSVKLRKISFDDENQTICYTVDDKFEGGTPAIDPSTEKNFSVITDFELLRGKNVCYPKTDGEESEIYEWFVNNHGGYKHYSGKPGGEPTNMPNARVQMTFREHMYALEPELRPTGAPMKNARGARGRGNAGNNGSRNSNQPKRSNSNPVVEVKVEFVRDDGTIFFKHDGVGGRVYGDRLNGRSFKKGDVVKVRLFKGGKVDGKGRQYAVYDLAE